MKHTRNLLVVDDDHSVRQSLRRLLESEGYHVEAAQDIHGALERVAGAEIDLAILDVNLGSESGWDLCRALADQTPLIPLIIVTGEWDQFENAARHGAEALMEKPIDVPMFLETVADLLSERDTGRLTNAARRKEGHCRYVPRHYESALNHETAPDAEHWHGGLA